MSVDIQISDYPIGALAVGQWRNCNRLGTVFITETGIGIVSSDSIRDIRILENIATIRIVTCYC
jgi:hypothetical protein